MLLVSADFSQVELRLLAQLSGDVLLQELLARTGRQGDLLCHIAAAWLQQQGTAGVCVL